MRNHDKNVESGIKFPDVSFKFLPYQLFDGRIEAYHGFDG